MQIVNKPTNETNVTNVTNVTNETQITVFVNRRKQFTPQ